MNKRDNRFPTGIFTRSHSPKSVRFTKPFPVDLRSTGINSTATLQPYNGGKDTGIYGISTTNVHFKTARQWHEKLRKEKECVLLKDDKQDRAELSASDIIKAINQGKKDIIEKIQDPTFRFPSNVGGDLINASDLSEAFAVILAESRSKTGKQNAIKGVKKRNEKANDYAIKAYYEIKQLKDKTGISTFQATVDLLTKEQVKTPSGGLNWHIGTLQDLHKRWEKLGLVQPKHKPK